MHIGLDIRKAFDSGIGSYIRGLLGTVEARETSLQWTFFADSVQKLQLQEAAWLPPSARICWSDAGKYSLSELVTLSRTANRQSLDIFHEPHWTLPLGLSARRIVTIHDIIPLRFPQYFSRAKRTYARAVIAHACRTADRILTDSQFSRDDLIREFNIAPERVVVIPLAASDDFTPASPEAIESFCARHKIARPYLLFAGNFKPHKNLPFLLRAFAATSKEAWPNLVLIGAKSTPEYLTVLEELGIANRVVFPGHISQEELVCAFSGAGALVFPSLYEGFGLPALEAMACGTPVVASNAASLPEVVGDAGLLFDPYSQSDLLVQLQKVRDADVAAKLRQRGFARAKEFSFENTARQTFAVYRETLK